MPACRRRCSTGYGHENRLRPSQVAQLNQQLAAVFHGGVVRLIRAEEAPHRRQGPSDRDASTVMVTGLPASAAIAGDARAAARAQKTIDPARTSVAFMYFPRLRARIWTGPIGLRKECAVRRTADITMDMNATELVIAPTAKCPAHGARHGTGFVHPFVLAQSFPSGGPALVAAMPEFPEEMCIRDRIEQSNTQIEIGIAMVNFFQMR